MEYPVFLPGWETVALLGEGGFSKVYKIKKVEDGEEFYSALKVITIPSSPNEYDQYIDEGYTEENIATIFRDQIKGIVSEFKMMAGFRGMTNIVSYEDHYINEHEDGRGYTVLIKMELLETLIQYYRRAPFGEETIVKVGLDICRALQFCAKENIVHRDIKPQNIFVNKYDDFKLGDFGIARTMSHTTRATKIGTYSYIAPEVYSGKPYNATTDIYSLGLVLYWLLNERRLPFLPLPPEVPTASMQEEAMKRRLSGETIPAPKNGCDELKEVVLKALAFEPTARYQTAKEFYEALEEVKYILAHKSKVVPPVVAPNVVDATVDLNNKSFNSNIGKTSSLDETSCLEAENQVDNNIVGCNEDTQVKKVDRTTPINPITPTATEKNKQYDVNLQDKKEKSKDALQNKNSVGGAKGTEASKNGDTPKDKKSKSGKIISIILLIVIIIIAVLAVIKGCFMPDDNVSDGSYDIALEDNSFSYVLNDGTLTITGTGKMPAYTYDSKAPWYNERREINKVIIKEGITSIGHYAFESCTSLTSITIPDSVTSIGDYAFYNCTSLTSITIPDSVTSIGNNAFRGCTSLTSITIPDSVTSIGGYAFYNCTSLTSITIPDSVTSIGKDAFYSCTSLTSITIGESVTSIGDDAFFYCTSLTSITIPDSVTSIGDYAFACCESLTSITIPDSVTSIGKDAFQDCTSLTSITIGDSVTSIGYAAFRDCNSLTSVTFSNPNGWYVTIFQGASSGTAVTLKNKTTAAEYLRDTYSEYYWFRT